VTDVPLPFPEPVASPPPTAAAAVDTGATGTDVPAARRFDAWRVLAAPPALLPFIEAGLLAPVDVHVATTLGRVLEDDRGDVLLAAALAVRAPRLKHVCVDLRRVRDTIVAAAVDDADDAATADGARARVEADGSHGTVGVDTLPWPDVDRWLEALAASPLVAVRDPATRDEPDDAGGEVRPLTLAGDRLYLDRYWRYERRVARELHRRATRAVEPVDLDELHAGLDAAFDAEAPDRQRVAAAAAVTRHLAIVAGGPGTGKTTTVAAILQLLDAQAAALGRRPPAVALAAPTGKAAQRLTASLREAAARRSGGRADQRQGDASAEQPSPRAAVDQRLREATATTIHRLLGTRGRSHRFRHDRHDPLPHDVVVVDETSMVDLALLAKLLDAVRDDARVILLGDPHQLASVEAGSALGDVLGDPDAVPVRSAPVLATLRSAAGDAHVADTDATETAGVHDVTVVLDRVRRFRAGSGLDRLAAAIRAGDADRALHELATADDLTWLPAAADRGAPGHRGADPPELAVVRDRLVEAGLAVHAAAAAGEHAAALTALDRVRVLCAHRRGRQGVAGWVDRIESWLAATGEVDPTVGWYVGRPVLVTANDRRQQLWNGDLGVVVQAADGAGPAVAFPAPDGEGTRTLAPARLGEVETVHAMTVHKSQGSQVDHAVVVLPEPASRLCTRELLYTAVTRAKLGATVVASEAAVRATIGARIARTSGLADALRPT
jgi:exodeoxyribonuclease V alpha subunit